MTQLMINLPKIHQKKKTKNEKNILKKYLNSNLILYELFYTSPTPRVAKRCLWHISIRSFYTNPTPRVVKRCLWHISIRSFYTNPTPRVAKRSLWHIISIRSFCMTFRIMYCTCCFWQLYKRILSF